MNKNKTYYPIVAASLLMAAAIIPISFGGEKEQSQSVEISQVAEDDNLVRALKAKIIDPLTAQAERNGLFSRRGPTHQTSYHLVENTPKSSNGERTFKVMMKQVPLSKSAEQKSSEYLKLRYVEKEDQVMVNLKDAWVKLEDHPIIKMLPKIKPATDLNS